MRTFSFGGSRMVAGFAVKNDDRLGPILFLGEEGRGRRFEKLSLDRTAPPSVQEGQVLNCKIRKVEPRVGADKQFQPFWVLERNTQESDHVLVRINTCGTYTRDTQGSITTYKGSPVTHVSGHGARGDAGRIGGWADAIVELGAGDVLKVKIEGGYKTPAFAIYLNQAGVPVAEEWTAFQNEQTARAAKDAVPDRITGTVRLFRHAKGVFTPGIAVVALPVGVGVMLGTGEKPLAIPFVGFDPGATEVMAAAAGKVGERVVLHAAGDEEPNNFIVRWQTVPGKRTSVTVDKLEGEPSLLASRQDDSLWVLRPGDAIVASGSSRLRVVENRLGQPVATQWNRWELADAIKAPTKYIAQGKAPWQGVPVEWIGRVVELKRLGDTTGTDADLTFDTMAKGELVEVRPDCLVVNVAWQTGDQVNQEFTNGVWVLLDQWSKVAKPEQPERARRDEAKGRFAALMTDLRGFQSAPFADCLPRAVQEQLRAFLLENVQPETTITDQLEVWAVRAGQLLETLRGASGEAKKLHQERTSGKLLINFGGHFRRMGNSGNCDFWVVLPDGTLKSPDRTDFRKRYTAEGNKHWNQVGGVELALSWDGDTNFTVNYRPAELTREQLDAVTRIEQEDLRVTLGSFGLNAEANRAKELALTEVRRVLPKCPVTGAALELEDRYLELVGEDGTLIASGGLVNRLLPREIGPEQQQTLANRTATLARSFRTSAGVLELWVYDKYGDTNLNARLRPLTEKERAPVTQEPAATEEATAPPTADQIGQLLARFGSHSQSGRSAKPRR